MLVEKRNGDLVPFDPEKINKVLEWACDGIKNVSVSDVALTSNISIYNKITTSDIHEVMIQSAYNLITEETPNYQWVAGRLRNYALRKLVWGSEDPPKLFDHLVKNKKIYDSIIWDYYTESDIHKIGRLIKHDRDFNFTHAGIQQMVEKYLVQDRTNGKIYETPQFAFILIPMILFRERENRYELIKKAYNAISKFKINLPTPILAGVRTNTKYYSSCVLVNCDDTLDSIFSSAGIIGKYTARRSGIGLNMGKIRAIYSPIRDSEVLSTGIIPFLKVMESSVKSTSQNGLRGGGATVSVPWWHNEIEDVVVLKNNAGTDDNRVKKLDYCVQIDKLFYDRILANEDITLFCPHEAKGLYEAFGTPEFEEKYKKAESKKYKLTKKIKATELAKLIARERLETGRIYVMHIDHCNTGPWKEKVEMTNLCVAPETLLLTKDGNFPIAELEDSSVEVWNGKQWSETVVKKTGENQKLVTVILSDGKELDCTLYHKWYTVKDYNDQRNNILTEKRTHELKIGDKLCKFDTPVIDGNEEFKYPYTHGLYSADGTKSMGRKQLALYGEKKELVPFLDIERDNGEDASGRRNLVLKNDMAEKFIIPLRSSVETKLLWLAGLLDGDGTIARNGTNESIQIASVEPNFLKEVQILLQSLGVQSKISFIRESGEYLLPDGRGGSKLYQCKDVYRLLISSNGLYKLSCLGFKPNRLKFNERLPQRDASKFVKVVDIIDNDRYDDTYCVNEPLEHKAVFNGILTGNCVEILQPTKPLQSFTDEDGEIGICILSAVNLLESKPEEYEEVCDIIVNLLDELISYQNYPFKAAENFCKKRRSLGVGVTNFAAYLASMGLNHESPESIEVMSVLSEQIQYYLLLASAKLAKEFGACEKYSDTLYSEGWLPNQKFNDSQKVSTPVMDWDSLAEMINEYGLRHSTLTAQMPCESSSITQCSTNGIEPIRSFLTVKSANTSPKKVLTPYFPKWKDNYSKVFELKNNDCILKLSAAMQEWFDMSISTNTNLNYEHFSGGSIPLKVVIQDMMKAHKLGVRTLYYNNTPKGNKEKNVDDINTGCESGACSI